MITNLSYNNSNDDDDGHVYLLLLVHDIVDAYVRSMPSILPYNNNEIMPLPTNTSALSVKIHTVPTTLPLIIRCIQGRHIMDISLSSPVGCTIVLYDNTMSQLLCSDVLMDCTAIPIDVIAPVAADIYGSDVTCRILFRLPPSHSSCNNNSNTAIITSLATPICILNGLSILYPGYAEASTSYTISNNTASVKPSTLLDIINVMVGYIYNSNDSTIHGLRCLHTYATAAPLITTPLFQTIDDNHQDIHDDDVNGNISGDPPAIMDTGAVIHYHIPFSHLVEWCVSFHPPWSIQSPPLLPDTGDVNNVAAITYNSSAFMDPGPDLTNTIQSYDDLSRRVPLPYSCRSVDPYRPIQDAIDHPPIDDDVCQPNAIDVSDF